MPTRYQTAVLELATHPERVIGTIRRECWDHVIVSTNAACIITCQHSAATITEAERTPACRRTARNRGQFRDQKPGRSFPSLKSVVFTIATSAALREQEPWF
jgi:hypothetical protein